MTVFGTGQEKGMVMEQEARPFAPIRTSIVIDSCAWNYLFKYKIDLSVTFPQDRYLLSVTREVEIELLAIPDIGSDGEDKRRLKAYIADSIAANQVRTSSVFGFASVEPDGTLSAVQVYGGFGQGTWQSDADQAWHASAPVRGLQRQKRMKTGLAQNQADTSLGVRSFDSIVLTNEDPGNKGPLQLAARQGGHVIYLSEVKGSGPELANYVEAFIARNDTPVRKE